LLIVSLSTSVFHIVNLAGTFVNLLPGDDDLRDPDRPIAAVVVIVEEDVYGVSSRSCMKT